jgi:Protein of unknown function (DUF1572)
MSKWDEGWGRLLRTLEELKGDDLARDIQVR